MKILFLMIAYPDCKSNSNMYTDLTHEFMVEGHDVFVAAPGNNSVGLYSECGVKVLRIKTLPLFNTSIIIKGLANLLLPIQYKLAIKHELKDIHFDLIITATPPITFIETIRSLKSLHKSKVYLILRDIFPQNAKDLGLIRNPLVFNFFRKKEKKLYLIADKIGCMSQKNIDFICKHNQEVDHSKLHLLPNWTMIEKSNGSAKNLKSGSDFKDKFVAVFGGNFGVPQGIDFLLDVAEKLKENPEIQFVLIGEGTEKLRIRKKVADMNLENVVILDQLSRNDYLEFVKGCDVGLVNLSDKFTIPNIPSRTLSYWSLKLPVLAAVDRNTDYGNLLNISGGGLWSITGNVDDYIAKLFQLLNNPEQRRLMGENGYNYMVNELNPSKAYATIVGSI
jgi:glycosyltransferase involved in cell wall biosynthesis